MARIGTDLYDLEVVDQAYGAHSDLYLDVLRVSYLASEEEIQSAFFDRRSELFETLSRLSNYNDNDEVSLSQRRFAERRMDAVVMSFRILKDPALRAIYEGERERRIANRSDPHGQQEDHDPSCPSNSNIFQEERSPRGVSSIDEIMQPLPFDQNLKRQNRKQNSTQKVVSKSSVEISVTSSPRKSSRKSYLDTRPPLPPPETSEESAIDISVEYSLQDTETEFETEGDGSLTEGGDEDLSQCSDKKENSNNGVIDRIRESPMVKTIVEEVNGAYLDTYSAFDQVFNAFTLQERDIEAVCGRIKKAKRQLNTRN
mmetsp:Transcript_1021/g.1279  ORF Transcript_1021/g.1279 Transcript_1021/m.1279 type:complete len:314 (+) Transcript_1021:40-981(+)